MRYQLAYPSSLDLSNQLAFPDWYHYAGPTISSPSAWSVSSPERLTRRAPCKEAYSMSLSQHQWTEWLPLLCQLLFAGFCSGCMRLGPRLGTRFAAWPAFLCVSAQKHTTLLLKTMCFPLWGCGALALSHSFLPELPGASGSPGMWLHAAGSPLSLLGLFPDRLTSSSVISTLLLGKSDDFPECTWGPACNRGWGSASCYSLINFVLGFLTC